MSSSGMQKSKRNLQSKYKPEMLLDNADKSVCEKYKACDDLLGQWENTKQKNEYSLMHVMRGKENVFRNNLFAFFLRKLFFWNSKQLAEMHCL